MCKLRSLIYSRGGVLEDVLGLEDVLEDTFWSPWPRSLKSLALASRPQVLENWPVLGSRTAVFFELLKFCGALEKFFGKRFFVEIAWKLFVKTFFFFWRALALVSLVLGLGLEHSCPWPRECLFSERLSSWPWIFLVSLALASSLVSSTPPLIYRLVISKSVKVARS